MVTKMPVARIEDIADVMRDRLGEKREIEITEIGAKPGEKMYEELMNDEEVRRTYEYENFFVVASAFADMTAPQYAQLRDCPRANRPYNSALEPAISRQELQDYLVRNGII